MFQKTGKPNVCFSKNSYVSEFMSLMYMCLSTCVYVYMCVSVYECIYIHSVYICMFMYAQCVLI